MTAAEAKDKYEYWKDTIVDLKASLKEAHAKATEFSNLYGRLRREELHENGKPPGAGRGREVNSTQIVMAINRYMTIPTGACPSELVAAGCNLADVAREAGDELDRLQEFYRRHRDDIHDYEHSYLEQEEQIREREARIAALERLVAQKDEALRGIANGECLDAGYWAKEALDLKCEEVTGGNQNQPR